MKRNNLFKKILPVMILAIICPTAYVKAQDNNNKIYLSGMWQFNFPAGNNYSNVGSGWGADIEGYYKIMPNLDAGLFINWQSNNKYVGRRTYTAGTSSVTMDQDRSLFQLPFGVMGNYILKNGMFEPYVGLKMGANYAKYRTFSNVFETKDDNWGFFVSPEIGLTFYPMQDHTVGFKLSGYYGYATNKYHSYYDMDGINNLGFRLGIVIRLY